MFRHQAWISTAAYHIGLLALCYAIYAGSLWIGTTIALYFIAGFTISVGYHRLFCHRSYETNRFWHRFFAYSGILFLYSSPLQWAVTHHTHHMKSDTEMDPHEGPLKLVSLLRKGYRDVPLDTIKGRRLLRDKMHLFIDKYYMAIWSIMFALMLMLSWQFTLYAYLPALGVVHLVAALHQTFSHIGGGPRDLWFLEYIIPSAGEWLHGYHHKHWRAASFKSKWYHLDLGGLLIKLIKA
jgi:fatty-acid desaturase